ncbi:MAG: rRNA pseudouridine synthase [Pseudomonadales bacterium]|jgi:23S rRNA pseudouridine2605 synthase|nr:rRNA pseudouridine synthase [Pseudomonadales bacterium]
MQVRLQKFLANQGVASRRKCEELIVAGKVEVDGGIVTELGTKVDPTTSKVKVNGKKVVNETVKEYYLLYKPTGYVTTTEDELGRKNVLELLPKTQSRLFPVGRLDIDTSGLIILTNDGDLTYKLTHPKYHVDKVYEALISGKLTNQEIRRFTKGLNLDHRRTAPAELEIIYENDGSTMVRVTIHEGRNHQVRRMFKALNHEVIKLKRVAMGNLNLGTLGSGQYRQISQSEVNSLLD